MVADGSETDKAPVNMAKYSRSSLLSVSLRPVLLISFAGLAGMASGQQTGEFSGALFGTGNYDTVVGIDTTKTFPIAVDLGSASATTINGVSFAASTGGNASGLGTGTTTWAFANTGQTTSGGTNPGGNLGVLTNGFIYGTANNSTETLTLGGLTVGQTYVVTFYNRSWEAAGARGQNLGASGASASAGYSYDQNVGAAGQGSFNVLRYTFQAATASQVLTFVSNNATPASMHQYGFSMEQVYNNTYTGGSTWSTSTWSGAVPSGQGKNAFFGTQGAATAFDLDSARTVGHLQFDGANPWTVNTSNSSALTLAAETGGVSTLSALSGAHTINPNITLNNNVVKVGAGTLALNGVISGAAGTGFRSSAGTLVLGNTANTFTGELIMAGGSTVNVASLSDYGVASAIGARTLAQENTTVTGVGLHFQGGTLQYTGSTPQSTNRHIRMLTGNGATIDASGSNPNATLSFTQSGANINLFDTAGARTLTLTGTNTGANTFAINLTNQGANATSINKAGAGTWRLTNNGNSYSGLTQISGGVLNVSSLSNYGVNSAIGGRTLAQETATGNGIGLWFGPGTATGTLQYTGSTPQSTDRMIRVGTGGATFDASGSNPAATMSFTRTAANINFWDTGGNRTITLTGTNTGDNLFALNIQDHAATGQTSVVKNGPGTWVLSNTHNADTPGSATNTWSGFSGAVTINGGVLKTSLNGTLGVATSPIVFGGGNNDGRLAVSGGLSIAKPLTINGRLASGPAIENLGGSNTFNGAITLQPGGNMYGLMSTAGTLTVNGAVSSPGLTGTPVMNLDGAGSGVLGSGLADFGATMSVNKAGAGTWALTTSSSYSGGTMVVQGTLLANNTTGSATGSGNVSVFAGATFGGTGAISGGVITAAGAFLSPGASIESLAVGSAGGSGTLVIEYDAAAGTPIDLLTVAGSLDITTMPLALTQTGAALTDPVYPFASYGSLTGTQFAGVTGLPTGYAVDYNYLGGNVIALVAIPEHSSTAVVLGGLGMLGMRRRRVMR